MSAARVGLALAVVLSGCKPIPEVEVCPRPPRGEPPGCTLTDADRYLRFTVLGPDVLHFEQGALPVPSGAIPTSPMTLPREPVGAEVEVDGNTWRTPSLALSFSADEACLAVQRADGSPLATLCPADGGALEVREPSATDAYGLGQRFRDAAAFGDRLGTQVAPGTALGNAMVPFLGGHVGATQIPFLLAVDDDGASLGLYVDTPEAQTWDLSTDPWRVTAAGPLRGFVFVGPDPLTVRSAYLDQTGRPPVPPRAAFGLWISEYGYDDWDELTDKLDTLAAAGFPVDGAMLDLYWFGGVPDRMGSLRWDTTRFPAPADTLAALAADRGVGVMLIEEPFVVDGLPEYDMLAAADHLVRSCFTCGPVALDAWWGRGGMIDWTNPAGAAWWHTERRAPLIDAGIVGHWTDLGEPESYSRDGVYLGGDSAVMLDQAQAHNLYNLYWTRSIWEGYADAGTARRPFVLSRSGTAGSQRFGAALWSGDIAGNPESFAAHLDAQGHVAVSGIDYYGSDIGGFRRQADVDDDDLYTAWFAMSALTDVPVRPHTNNTGDRYETAPDRIGDPDSNRYHLALRYALVPYYVSLAHHAWQTGAPVVAPPVLRFPTDLDVRDAWADKVVGPSVWATAVVDPTADTVATTLPAGAWVDLRTGAWYDGGAHTLSVRDGTHLRIPVLLRAGAVVPTMAVDALTMNTSGRRRDGSARPELGVLVAADAEASSFALVEDDGWSVAYAQGDVRVTTMRQRREADEVTVTVEAASGWFDGAADAREIVVRLYARDAVVTGVTVDGAPMAAATDALAVEAGAPGWAAATHRVVARTGARTVHAPTEVRFSLR